jgi:hypothetical protein
MDKQPTGQAPLNELYRFSRIPLFVGISAILIGMAAIGNLGKGSSYDTGKGTVELLLAVLLVASYVDHFVGFLSRPYWQESRNRRIASFAGRHLWIATCVGVVIYLAASQ